MNKSDLVWLILPAMLLMFRVLEELIKNILSGGENERDKIEVQSKKRM